MLDPTGRERLLSLLRALPGDGGPTVVHATHRADEITAADAVVQLGSRPTPRVHVQPPFPYSLPPAPESMTPWAKTS